MDEQPVDEGPGRKYAMGRLLFAGCVLYGVACLLTLIYDRTLKTDVAGMLGDITLMALGIMAAFSGSNAYISGQALKTQAQQGPIVSSLESETTKTRSTTAPAGTVAPEPAAG